MTAVEFILTLSLLLNGGLLWLLPALSRPDIFFSVTVAPDVRTMPAARGCLRRYRFVVMSATAVALLAMWTTASPRAKVAILLGQTVASFVAWMRARRAVMPFSVSGSPSRSASLTPRDLRLPGGPVTLAGPFLLLAAVAFLLYSNWNAIPDRFPTRWSLDGSPLRWTTKSVRSVYGGVAFGGALLVAFTLQTLFLLKRTRQIGAPVRETGVRAPAAGIALDPARLRQ